MFGINKFKTNFMPLGINNNNNDASAINPFALISGIVKYPNPRNTTYIMYNGNMSKKGNPGIKLRNILKTANMIRQNAIKLFNLFT